jgi:hypothetical protein
MTDEKLAVTPADLSVAAFNLHLATLMQLGIAGVLTADQLKFVAATAASMSRSQGNENAASLIEVSLPAAVGTNISIEAMKQGVEIKREPRDGE